MHWKKLADMGLDAAPSLYIRDTNLLCSSSQAAICRRTGGARFYAIQEKGVDIVISPPRAYKPVQEDIDVAREMGKWAAGFSFPRTSWKGIFNPRRAPPLLKTGWSTTSQAMPTG